MALRMSGRLRALARQQQPEPELDSIEVDEQVGVDVLPDVATDESETSDAEAEALEQEEYQLDDDLDEDNGQQESRTPSIAPLKIKFKVKPAAPASASRSRRARAAVRIDSDESESEEAMPQNTRLTKRQAALAKARRAVDGSDYSQGNNIWRLFFLTLHENIGDEPELDVLDADPISPRRRTALDPTEVALRKEESARKRRNVSERKLLNEKTETINRLLKKQSGTRKKKGKAPAAGLSTLVLSTGGTTPAELQTPTGLQIGPELAEAHYSADAEELVEEATIEGLQSPVAAMPNMSRWISTTMRRGEEQEAEATMRISFSLPTLAASIPQPPPTPLAARPPATCAVKGCQKDRRYRLVGGEWGVGACGMAHLKILERSK
ncbi:PAPA-1 domain-containing protein [Mycena indigotica]|uniref:PAPA-1 domain-containing protein n=1 Tax=Mycena indigotica TaxID=2126181 RepID=A0A8H6S4D2_9AGAR|nr:PAPA-1 domain-containing protein [Mycena indigotica]KAF7292581.1 PAPA-1 domain-containing protein [Mycena indigotica]